MTTPADRLRTARKAAGYTSAAAFAHANDIKGSTYGSHENGTRNLSIEAAKEYAGPLDVTWQWLMFGDEVSAVPAAPATGRDLVSVGGHDYALLPVYDLRLSAGPGSWAGDESEPLLFEPYRFQWLRSLTNAAPEMLIIARVDGDSMETTLFHGDHVLLDRSRRTLNRDGIFGYRLGEALNVKRISVNPRTGLVTVISDNPRYQPYPDISPDDLDIIGRVIWLGRQV